MILFKRIYRIYRKYLFYFLVPKLQLGNPIRKLQLPEPKNIRQKKKALHLHTRLVIVFPCIYSAPLFKKEKLEDILVIKSPFFKGRFNYLRPNLAGLFVGVDQLKWIAPVSMWWLILADLIASSKAITPHKAISPIPESAAISIVILFPFFILYWQEQMRDGLTNYPSNKRAQQYCRAVTWIAHEAQSDTAEIRNLFQFVSNWFSDFTIKL